MNVTHAGLKPLPFDDEQIPPEFLKKAVIKPQWGLPFFCIGGTRLTLGETPVIEQKRVLESQDKKIALIITDLCFYQRFDSDSDLRKNQSREEAERNVAFALQMYTPEEQECLKELGKLEYGADLTGRRFIFDPIERQVLLYSEGKTYDDKDRRHFTAHLTYMDSFFINSKWLEMHGIEIFHKYATSFKELAKSHEWFSRNGGMREWVPHEDIGERALKTLEGIREDILLRRV